MGLSQAMVKATSALLCTGPVKYKVFPGLRLACALFCGSPHVIGDYSNAFDQCVYHDALTCFEGELVKLYIRLVTLLLTGII